ncbi:MAG: DUF839 domain-containing protein [Bacteroidia bacterium]|nr:DUF839 domain-containing protein [Bacteroidia bacterium]
MKTTGLVSLGFLGLQSFASGAVLEAAGRGRKTVRGYGSLMPDADGLINLPRGFQYQIISRQGDRMSDGWRVPGKPDGMAAFPGPKGKTLLLRNHELDLEMQDLSAFAGAPLPQHLRPLLYDAGNSRPAPGGVTTLVYDTRTREVEAEFLSLAGTLNNCAGGPTPWGTWITCEETVYRACSVLKHDHGYAFEVPASAEIRLHAPVPLYDMGRFQHEAVAVDPATSIVYLTEDRADGLIYRFLPRVPGQLTQGGKLQALVLRDWFRCDSRNWQDTRQRFPEGERFAVSWIDLDDIHAPDDDLRERGHHAGAVRFARGEGMWFGKGECFFACTMGGREQEGQIFRYIPSPFEGTSREQEQPGQLELFIEPNNTKLLSNCDNVTQAPNGDLVVCEDTMQPRILGVTPQGSLYVIAENVGIESEFAGPAFSPDGSTLFVNVQHGGMTFAITGPWADRRTA